MCSYESPRAPSVIVDGVKAPVLGFMYIGSSGSFVEWTWSWICSEVLKEISSNLLSLISLLRSRNSICTVDTSESDESGDHAGDLGVLVRKFTSLYGTTLL